MAIKKKVSLPIEKKEMTLEEALKIIQKNGLIIASPSDKTQEKLVEESISLLGKKGASKKSKTHVVNEEVSKTPITITLGFSHFINGNSYGPGVVTLDASEAEIASILKAHDFQAVSHQIDTVTLRSQPRCFMILEKNTVNGRSNIKREMPAGFFDSPDGMNNDSLVHSIY